MATVSREPMRLWHLGRQKIADGVSDLGDLSLFAFRILAGIRRRSSYNTLLPICYAVGVNSIPVVMITGAFIGMVLAVQAYGEFAHVGLATRLGQIINISVVRELGPVLAAVMLAGRVGGAMAAELATMRITEQIDALACLGANPIHYLGTPRFLACVLLIPLLTILANFMGVLGGALVCIDVYHVEAHHYWENTRGFVGMWDIDGRPDQADVFRRRHRRHLLPSRLLQRCRRRRRRPGRHPRLRRSRSSPSSSSTSSSPCSSTTFTITSGRTPCISSKVPV